jgi:hypothetical protein
MEEGGADDHGGGIVRSAQHSAFDPDRVEQAEQGRGETPGVGCCWRLRRVVAQAGGDHTVDVAEGLDLVVVGARTAAVSLTVAEQHRWSVAAGVADHEQRAVDVRVGHGSPRRVRGP